jgi:hypothetical protein
MAWSLYRGPALERRNTMSFFSWLRNWKRSTPASRRRHQTSSRQRTGFSPRLEALEDRALPSTLTVTTFEDSGTGSLRAEIAAAKAGDTIVFASPLVSGKGSKGKPTTSTTITLIGSELLISKNLTIQGPAPGQTPITVSGGQYANWRVFEIGPNAVVTLSGLDISNGHAIYNQNDGRGGGIKNEGTLTLSNCTLEYNVSDFDGGGIYNAGTLTVSGCFLGSNQAYTPVDSGAVAYYGGGICNIGTLTVTNTTFDHNYGIGGGISNFGTVTNFGTATVSGCRFSFNNGNFGVAIEAGGSLTVSGSTFVWNYIDGAYTDGGGNTFITGGPGFTSFTASAASVTAGSSLTLTANITDSNPNSSIIQVAFSDANGVVGYGTQTSPGVWTLTFSTAGWAAGTYTFSADALDNYGVEGVSSTVTVQVI